MVVRVLASIRATIRLSGRPVHLGLRYVIGVGRAITITNRTNPIHHRISPVDETSTSTRTTGGVAALR